MRRIARVGAILLLGIAACGDVTEFAPSGRISDVPEAFVWPAWKGADSYLLRIFRTDGTVLFESDRLEAHEYRIDRGLRRRILGAREFTWLVRIYDGDRIAGSSDRIRVVLVARR